jgi:hypothetical protein
MSEIVYLNRDNQIVLELRTNEILQDLSGLTRAQLIIGTTTLDSATVSGYFDWTDTGFGTGTLVIDVGSATLTEGFHSCCYLIIYDNTNANGIVWGKKFTIVVEDI